MNADFEWKPQYSVGNSDLDDQHKMLFDICRRIHSLDKSDEAIATEQYHKLIDEIARYIRTHFHYEQYLLQKHNYADYEVHVTEHAQMLTEFSTIALHAKSLGESDRLAEFLANWVQDHIFGSDMKYRDIFKN